MAEGVSYELSIICDGCLAVGPAVDADTQYPRLSVRREARQLGWLFEAEAARTVYCPDCQRLGNAKR